MRTKKMTEGSDIKKFLKDLSDSNTEFVDFRYTDMTGMWRTITYHQSILSESVFNDGIMFDGSSIPGWRGIENSDMVLRPDLSKVYNDVYADQPTKVVICDVIDPVTNQGYSRDPRTVAKRAEQYLLSTGIGDKAFYGPEPEFFVFDEVQFNVSPFEIFAQMLSRETTAAHEGALFSSHFDPTTSGQKIDKGKGYCQTSPLDQGTNIRGHMLSAMKEAGLVVIKHHHEVGTSQHELSFEYDKLTRTADNLQMYKNVVRATAYAQGQTATFMPKPVFDENGSGMHVHMSVWKGDTPLFLGNQYCDMSELGLYFIGGILKHARALNAFTNSTTNSYKRLVPGYEAPVYLAYAANNRSAAIRIPHVENKKAKRIEARFPDPLSNPYFAFSAMLMAGLDGIQNKILPGDPMERNLYEDESAQKKSMCGSLREALEELNRDRDFLLKGNVFESDLIDAYIELKLKEVAELERRPHPVEFSLYYAR
jgi:glutamine synthetase